MHNTFPILFILNPAIIWLKLIGSRSVLLASTILADLGPHLLSGAAMTGIPFISMLSILVFSGPLLVQASDCGIPDIVPSDQRKNLTMEGEMAQLGIVVVEWTSARVGTHLVKYLMEEALGYNTVFSAKTAGSAQAAMIVAGCTNQEAGIAKAICPNHFSKSHVAWKSGWTPGG